MPYTKIGIMIFAILLVLSGQTVYGYDQVNSVSATKFQQADQWQIVVYDDAADMLYWLDETGAVTSLERPQLLNEGDNPQPEFRLTPDGRILIITAFINSGQHSLGFYDLETNRFLQSFSAPSNEVISLGSAFSANADATHVAIGFSTITADQSSWRVVQYDLSSGNLVDELRSDGPEVRELDESETFTGRPLMPYVNFYDGSGDNAEIHIQFISPDEVATEYPSLAWEPRSNPEVALSPYTTVGLDFSADAHNALFVYQDESLGSVGDSGLFHAYNAVAQGVPNEVGNFADPTVIYADSEHFFAGAQWAANGDMVLLNMGTASDDPAWYYMNLDDPKPTEIEGAVSAVVGLPNGFAWIDDNGKLGVYADGVYELDFWQAPGKTPQFIWPVTSISDLSTEPAPSSSNSNTPTEEPSANSDAVVHCADAPASIVEVGSTAQVRVIDGAYLNVRAEPDGEIIVQISEETPFTIIGGPACAGVFTWWEASLEDGTTGWVAEGDAQYYYIEPLPDGGTRG